MLTPVEYDSGYYLKFEWCRYSECEWCKEMMKTGFGTNFGNAGCYNPYEKTICIGLEAVNTAWHYVEDKNRIIDALVDVLVHEEMHRVIHKVTRSIKASREFDLLFSGLYQYELNREYFGYTNTFDWFSN